MTRRNSGSAQSGSGAPSWVAPAVVALLTIAAFVPAFSAGFVAWDDDRNFLNNPHWRGLGAEQLAWMWTTFHMGHYIPLSWMTLGLDYLAWGMNPTGYHATNVVLHAVNAVLIYFVARRLLQLAAPALRSAHGASPLTYASVFAALVFAVHPLRVESVAWITERRDVLSGCFFTLAVACYLRARHAIATRRWYWAAVGVFACGLLAKASVMTVPAVLFILNCYPLKRLPGPGGIFGADARRVYTELLPFALLAALTAGLSLVALKPPDQLALGGKLAVSAYSFAFYLAKTLLPVGLSPLYEMPNEIDPSNPPFLAAYVVAAAVAGVAWRARKRHVALTVALVTFGVVLLPTIGFVQNGPQIAADRYTYHAAPALAILAGGALLVLSQRWALASRLIAAAVVFALGVATWQQTKVWHDSESLWSRAVAVDPSSPIAHGQLATEFVRQDRVDEAVTHFVRALALDSTYAEGHNNFGVALVRLDRVDEALVHYQRAVSLKPTYDEAYSNWGIAVARQGNAEQSIRFYAQAIAINPDNSTAHLNWGNALVRLGRPDEAIERYRMALSLRPDNADALLNWGVALARGEKFDEAILKFQSALAIQPNLADAKAYLVRALEMKQSQQRRP